MTVCTCMPVTGPGGKIHDKNCLLLQRRSARIIKAEVADVIAPAVESKPLPTSSGSDGDDGSAETSQRPAGGIRK